MAVYSREFVSRFIISYGFYERHYIRELFKFLERKDVLTHEKTCLDIGANIGNHSVRFSALAANLIFPIKVVITFVIQF